MNRTGNEPDHSAAGLVLRAYLLGPTEFEAALHLQRRLLYEVRGDRGSAALVLCEHPPLITVGRTGSRAHIHCDAQHLRARGWPVRWVNHGGGTLLHLPGQLAAYPVVPLDRLGLGVAAYLDRLHGVLLDLLGEFGVRGERRPGRGGVWVGGRPVAAVGVAVRDWVSYFGCVLHVNPDLEWLRLVRGGPGELPATSLERELREPVSPSLVRERFLHHFGRHFPCVRTSLFFHPPAVRGSPADARGVAPQRS